MRSAVLVALAGLAACTPSASARTDAGDAGAAGRAVAEAGEAGPSPAEAATEGDDPLPPSTSDDSTTRAKHLFEAITHDDPQLATDIVFPRDAYIQVKDAADPGKQWDVKVTLLFQRQVRALHKRTRGIERAQFVTFELGEPIAQAVPKRRDLKRTLWRVHHSRLTYTIDGKADHFDIGELTSWRGAWYVTKLHGGAT